MSRCSPRLAALGTVAAIASASLLAPDAAADQPVAASARADSAPGARAPGAAGVTLEYVAGSECPDEPAFVAAVRSRGGDLEQPPPELAGARVVISLQHVGSAFVGSVEVQARGAGARQVRGDDCEQAMQGVALITAAALHEAAPEAASPPAPSPAAPSAPSTRLERIGQFGADSIPVGAGALVFDNDMSFSLGAGVELGAVPGLVLPRYELSFSRANYVTTPEGAHYLGGGWLPRLRLALIGAGKYESGDESAQVTLVHASFGGCTALSYDLDGLVMLVCGELGVGLGDVDVRAANGAPATSQSVAFGLAGLELETRYAFGPFHIGLKLGATVSTPWSAERADGSELFRASPYAGHALISVGMHY